MLNTHFTNNDVVFFAVAFLSMIASVFFFTKGNMSMALRTLIISGFILRMIMAWIDPFLHTWDEQFHALVAKNMMTDPFHPMLVKEDLFPLDKTYWVNCHFWVHKPPLFLWQMALSMKIFGVNAFAIRFPSAVLSTLMIPAVYRMGKLIRNEHTGYFAAVILAFSNIHINSVSGFINTDHNDVVFAAYVLFSFWAFTEYIFSSRRKHVLLTGIFVAAAVLTKWLTGFLVIGIWGIVLLSNSEWRKSKRKWFDIILATFVGLFISMPWFIYVSRTYPEEWSAALASYSRHLYDSIAHEGTWLFHFDLVRDSLGWIFIAALLCGSFFFFRKNVSSAIRVFFSAAIIIVFGFYTFVPAKMPLFCFIVYPLLILIAAFAFCEFIEWLRSPLKRFHTFISAALTFLFAFQLLNIGRLEGFHTDRDPKDQYRKTMLADLESINAYKRAHYFLWDAVVFNCGTWHAAPFMFFNDVPAFDDPPSPEQLKAVIAAGKLPCIYNAPDLPQWIRNDYAQYIMRDSW